MLQVQFAFCTIVCLMFRAFRTKVYQMFIVIEYVSMSAQFYTAVRGTTAVRSERSECLVGDKFKPLRRFLSASSE